MKDSSKDSEFEGGEADVNATEWLAGERESGEGKGGAFTPPTQLVCSTGKGRGRVGPKKKVVRTQTQTQTQASPKNNLVYNRNATAAVPVVAVAAIAGEGDKLYPSSLHLPL